MGFGLVLGSDGKRIRTRDEGAAVRLVEPLDEAVDRCASSLKERAELSAERAAERYGVSQADILLELGRRKAVGGQEDMIIDVAIELARAHADQEGRA